MAMELMRAGEALLPFLAPSAHLRRFSRTAATASKPTLATRQWTSRSHQPAALHCSRSFRTFSTSHSARQADQPPTGDEQDRPRDRISQLLDATLDGTKGTPAASASRSSHFSSPSAQQSNPPYRAGTTGSEHSKISTFAEFQGSPQRGSNETLSSNSSSSLDSFQPPKALSVEELLSSIGSDRSRSSAPSGLPYLSGAPPSIFKHDPVPLTPPPFKLGPTVGRTVRVEPGKGIDVTRAFRNLSSRLKYNRVREDFNAQRFHERPGLKRKRLKSSRWKRFFKEQFQRTVKEVQDMKRQGW